MKAKGKRERRLHKQGKSCVNVEKGVFITSVKRFYNKMEGALMLRKGNV